MYTQATVVTSRYTYMSLHIHHCFLVTEHKHNFKLKFKTRTVKNLLIEQVNAVDSNQLLTKFQQVSKL